MLRKEEDEETPQEEINYESISCAKCGTTPDDVLILTCDHNLCLLCAAKNLRREKGKAHHSFQTVVCDVCGSATVLDPSSATELLSMLPVEDREIRAVEKDRSNREESSVYRESRYERERGYKQEISPPMRDYHSHPTRDPPIPAKLTLKRSLATSVLTVSVLLSAPNVLSTEFTRTMRSKPSERPIPLSRPRWRTCS